MNEVFVPTLHTFAMGNIFTGSCGAFRFVAEPEVIMKTAKEVDMEASSVTAKFWHGPFCLEKSKIEGEKTFPMTEEGRMELKAWLEENV